MSRRPLHPFAAAVLRTCRRRQLAGGDDRVLVALSGGADSTALLSALAALRDQGHLASVAALHVDHGLRPGSAAEADPCRELCERLRVPFERARVEVAPGNVQSQARRARYGALRAAADRMGASRIATGHTRGDQAETVLLRLLRGAGARGLSGIPPRRGRIVRPLIDRSRAEVVAYLRESGIGWLEDPTNATPRYLRNRVRAEVLPVLASLSPAVERTLARTADLLREDERALDRLARGAVAGASAAVEGLRALPAAARRRAVVRLWRAARGRRAGLGAMHVEAVLGLLGRPGPGRVSLPRGIEARCAYGTLSVGRVRRRPDPPAEVAIPGPGVYPVPGSAARIEVRLRAGAQLADVAWPLALRSRRPGDRFRPEKGAGSKKLKAWLIDRKVPSEERDRLLVLADRLGEVLWLPDLGARGAAPLDLRVVRGSGGPRDDCAASGGVL